MSTIKDIPDWGAAIKEAQSELGIQAPETFQQAAIVLGRAMTLLLISKNQKYGKANILNSADFGIDPKKGVALRMNDKFERLKNGLQGVDLGSEGFVETCGDLIGYNAIEILLELDWYNIPIKEMGDSK